MSSIVIKSNNTLYQFSSYRSAIDKFMKLWKRRKEAILMVDGEEDGRIWKMDDGHWNYYYWNGYD